MVRARGQDTASMDLATDPSLAGWVCTSCRFAVLASNPRALSRDIARYRQARALSVFQTLPYLARSHLVSRHRRGARILFAVAALTFAWFVHLVVADVPMRVALTWGSFSLMFAVLGLKRSYRAWQVSSGRLFEPGTFAYWLRHEKWLC
jgi:hypothetical protein